MKLVEGIWLPDHDTHFPVALKASIKVGGKATYQFHKYAAAAEYFRGYEHALDIGAHVGLWSMLMAADFDRITAFEPVAEHRACFARNVEKENVTLLPCALGEAEQTVGMETALGNTGNARVNGLGERVEMKRLDDLNVGPVDFIKIDVEGYETNVLRGAEETIRKFRPVIILEQKPGNAERYGVCQHDGVDMLKGWGMRQVQEIGGDHIMVW